MAQAYYQVSNGSQTLSSLLTGVNLWIPKNDSGISAATLYGSNDSGKTWTASLKLMANSSCSGNFLTMDDGTNNCSNFKSVPDANVADANAAVDAGTRRFKVVVATVNGEKSVEGPVHKLLFTQATGQAAVAASGLGIALDQLGSKSVKFTGQPYYVASRIFSGANSSGQSSWEGAPLASLKGAVSVAAANALCKSATASNATACDSSYNLTSGKIVNIDLNGADTAGRGVWVHYSLPTAN